MQRTTKFPRSAGKEQARLNELSGYRIVDTSVEARFDHIVELASGIFRAPIVYISFIDDRRQWIKAEVGFNLAETDRSNSFCSHTIQSGKTLVVHDARKDARFANSSLVTSKPGIRFYAGAPLVTPGGHRIGTICVADKKSRKRFDTRERGILKSFAALVMEQLELRRKELIHSAIMGFADATDVCMISADPKGMIDFVNQSATRMFGYSREEMIGQSLDIIVPERLRGAHHAGFARVAAGGSSKLTGKTVEISASRRNGSEFPIELSLSIWPNQRGVGIGAVVRDISERKVRDAKLLRLATHDTLTGLCNRHHFEHCLAEAYARKSPVTVILLDLDGFKDVNDSLGHLIGDGLLQTVAVRLSALVDGNIPIARLGGDEFALLLPDVADPLAAHAVASTLLTTFETPFEVAGNIFRLGVSIGFAIGPNDGNEPPELVASADFALYQAKRAGGKTIRMFERRMLNESASRRAMQDEVRRAHQQGNLELHYQPQVSFNDGKIVGAEALIRWRHPEHGLVLPGTFLPVIETSSLAVTVGWWILDQACRQLAEWRRMGWPELRISVNLFAAQFLSAGLVRQVTDVLKKHNLDPAALELEITEKIALHDADQAIAQIQQLRDLGIRIAMDDFGTGYASLMTLKQFPLTTLKIDRGFVKDILTDRNDAAITRAMLLMGAELGLETIAEGIETAEQEAALLTMACKVGQGYFYGRPVKPADFVEELRSRQTQLSWPLAHKAKA